MLVIGASGGVGMFAVQIAKALGARVTGVCSTAKTGMVRSIGADHVIDYTRDDFANGSRRYDLILDISGNSPLLPPGLVVLQRTPLSMNSSPSSTGSIEPRKEVIQGRRRDRQRVRIATEVAFGRALQQHLPVGLGLPEIGDLACAFGIPTPSAQHSPQKTGAAVIRLLSRFLQSCRA